MAALFLQAASLSGQETTPSVEDGSVFVLDEFVVSGTRASLVKARESKREAKIVSDTIVAEDIAKFPDLNLAESLQRLPGVAINREAGEGRRVSLRGLSSYFTRKPDVLIGHGGAMIDWLDQAGLPVPERVGFFRINVTESSRPCAGLDLWPQQLGATAVEAVVGMLHRRELGIPETPQAILIDSTMIEGPTIRAS